MIQVAREHHRPALGELDEEHLMARCMARRRHDDDGPIAKHVEVLVVEHSRLGLAQRAVVIGLNDALRLVGQHEVALGLLHDPCRRREVVRVGRVIGVVVRHREVVDVGG